MSICVCVHFFLLVSLYGNAQFNLNLLAYSVEYSETFVAVALFFLNLRFNN